MNTSMQVSEVIFAAFIYNSASKGKTEAHNFVDECEGI